MTQDPIQQAQLAGMRAEIEAMNKKILTQEETITKLLAMNLSPPLACVAPPVAIDPNLCAGRPGISVDSNATMAPLAVPAWTPGMYSSLAPAAPALCANANACAPGAAIDLATAAIGQAGRSPLRPPPVDVSAAINEVNAPHVQSQHFELPNGLAPPGPMRILISWLKVPTRCSPRWTPQLGTFG